MLKDSTAVIGLGLGGMTVTYEFQERNYLTYSVNGSEQDIKSIPNAKNSMRLEGYDGLAGNRELAYQYCDCFWRRFIRIRMYYICK